jgi:hypothetical protein
MEFVSDFSLTLTQQFFSYIRSYNKEWFAQNQDNVSEWSDMSGGGLLFQSASSKNPTKHVWCSKKNTSSH